METCVLQSPNAFCNPFSFASNLLCKKFRVHWTNLTVYITEEALYLGKQNDPEFEKEVITSAEDRVRSQMEGVL